jgi:hypothetical protein
MLPKMPCGASRCQRAGAATEISALPHPSLSGEARVAIADAERLVGTDMQDDAGFLHRRRVFFVPRHDARGPSIYRAIFAGELVSILRSDDLVRRVHKLPLLALLPRLLRAIVANEQVELYNFAK